MTSAATQERVLSPFERLAHALVDPERRERTMAMLLVGYALVWSIYGMLAKGSQDVHVDMGEMFAWSHAAGMGTPKHPPLGAWLVGLWFTIMPRTDWNYIFLAAIMPALALWIVWRLSADYLDPEKRVAGIALLDARPVHEFPRAQVQCEHGAHSVVGGDDLLVSALIRDPGDLWAALAGIGAAAAMLGKYWSICLIAGFGLAALADPRRALYFRSAAPWVSVAVGLALLAPHFIWLVEHDYGPITYAALRHKDALSEIWISELLFFAGFGAYLAPAVVGALLATRPTLLALHDMLVPASPQRRLANLVFFAPLLVAALAGIALRVDITALWMMPGATLLPILLLSSPLLVMPRKATIWLLAIAVAFPLLMVAAAPGIAMVIHRKGLPRYSDHYRLVAHALEKSWRASTDAPLAFLGGGLRPGQRRSLLYSRSSHALFHRCARTLALGGRGSYSTRGHCVRLPRG